MRLLIMLSPARTDRRLGAERYAASATATAARPSWPVTEGSRSSRMLVDEFLMLKLVRLHANRREHALSPSNRWAPARPPPSNRCRARGAAHRKHRDRDCRCRPAIHAPEPLRGNPGGTMFHDSHNVAIAPLLSENSAMVETSFPLVAGSRCMCALTLVISAPVSQRMRSILCTACPRNVPTFSGAALPRRQRRQASAGRMNSRIIRTLPIAPSRISRCASMLQVRKRCPYMIISLTPALAHGGEDAIAVVRPYVAIGLSSRMCLPCAGGGDGLCGMLAMRRADQHGVDIAARRAVPPPKALAGRRHIPGQRRRAAAARDSDKRARSQITRHRFGIGAPHETRADDADSYFVHSVHPQKAVRVAAEDRSRVASVIFACTIFSTPAPPCCEGAPLPNRIAPRRIRTPAS